MTVSILRTAATPAALPSLGRIPGLPALLRKELREWRRSRRSRVVLAVSTVILVVMAAVNWVMDVIARSLPPDVTPPGPVSLDPLANLLGAASMELVALVAIFAIIAVLVGERESGTLAWTASKPVSRAAIWLAKWIAATWMLWLVAGILPLVATTGLITVLYGAPPLEAVALLVLGAGATVAFYAALGLAAGTVVSSQAAVAGIGIGVNILSDLVAAVVPVGPVLPTSIYTWSLATAAGQPTGLETPVAWAIGVAILVAVAIRRMNRMEL